MTQKSVDLQLSLSAIKDSIFHISEQLSKANKELQHALILPPAELLEQIVTCRTHFEELRSRVLELAESLGVPTPPPDEMISVKNIETLLQTVAEIQKAVDDEVQQRALEILDRILLIRYSDHIDFPPLLECQAQARKFHGAVSILQDTNLYPVVEALASGEHPMAKLLTLISERESPNYQRLAELQTAVAQVSGMPLALAALTGKLIFLSDSESIAIETKVEDTNKVAFAVDIVEPEISTTVDSSQLERDPSDTTRVEAFSSAAHFEAEEEPVNQGQQILRQKKTLLDTPAKKQTDAQEIAVSILSSNLEQSRTALQYLIWQLICEDKLSLAFHLARCFEIQFPEVQPRLPPWIVRAVILGCHVRYEVGFGEIANILMNDFTNFSESLLVHGANEWNQAISLLLAASALRPALLAPNTDASQILLSLRLGEGLNLLYEYCQIIAKYGDQHLALDTKAIKTVKSQEEWKIEIALLSQEVDYWWSQASGLSLKTQARKIWKKWLESDGFIYEILSPIRQKDSVLMANTSSHVQVFKQKFKKLYEQDEIKRKIEFTKENLDANKKRDIHKDDIPKLYRYVGQAVDFCRRWIDLQESCLDRSNKFTESQVRQAEQLKKDLSSLHNAVLQELNTFESRNSSILILAGIFCCRTTVADIQKLFDPDAPLPIIEPDPRHLLHAELLKIPALPMDKDWKPEVSNQNRLVNGIFELVAQNDFTWSQAFDIHCEKCDHEATERIIEYLRTLPKDTTNFEELERVREESICECRDSLQRDIKETRNKIESAVALGILKEADRADYAAVIVEIEKDIQKTFRFYQEHNKLETIKSAIDEKKKLAIQNVRQRLTSLSLGLENSNHIRIIELLDKGDVLTANEYIDMLERGDTIPEPKIDLDDFSDFFPEKVAEFDKFMEDISKNPLVVIQKVQKRESFCGINLKRPPGAATDRAAEMLTAWFSAKRSRSIEQKNIQVILATQGFNTVQIRVNPCGGRTWVNVTTEVIRNKELCPVAAYGSAAHGQYRILCVWDRPTVEDILNAVGETSPHPAFVFFFGRLTTQRRRDLAWICRERRRTFVLIDDILMLYLCGVEEPRLPTLFNCALPFTFLEPYAATAGLVPPEIFYGRKQERDSIINPMGSCFIYGGRQLGKTALLRSVEREFHPPQEGRIAYWLDLKACGIGVTRPIEDIWSLLANRFKELEVVPRSVPTNVGVDTLLRHIENWLAQNKSRRILLLLDEADKFLESDGTLSRKNNKAQGFIQTTYLKGLMDRTERRFKVVFAGLHNVQRTTRLENHPLAHYGEPICIGPLLDNGEWREARNLIKCPLASIGYEISDDLVTRILSQTNYYPSLIQLYCQKLLKDVNENHLRKFDSKNTPPYQITDRQVYETYQSQNFRARIRERFIWTLQLDQRYEVIAYSIAYDSLNNHKGMVDGFSVSWVKDEVLTWWPEGFQSKSTDEIRALLEEMVGLGILRETNEGCFALRSPNVVLLLGTEVEIEEQLLKSREAPPDYDPETFRSAMQNDSFWRSPLTVQQESALRRRENGVSIIFGSLAAGLDELKDFLLLAVGQEFLFHIDR
ncbi:MAG: hypothetical protein DSM106950_39720 [Stigonema ocellatum SAG 48.90 = DSM 106950]|nr:hypothetical protein [Stigonema ocellatum SAG 48.90 = DSM 106950]